MAVRGQQDQAQLDRKHRKRLIDMLSLTNIALDEASCAKSKECLNAVKRAALSECQIAEGQGDP